MNKPSTLPLVVVILLCISCALALSAQTPDPETILEAFRESFKWTDCVAFHAESSGTSATIHRSEKSSYYNDHGRQISFTVTERAEDRITGEALDSGRSYRSIFSEQMDGFFHWLSVAPEGYTGDFEGTLYSYEDGPAAYRYHLARQPSLRPFFGIDVLFSDEALCDLLTPDVVQIREDTLNETRAVVIEAQIPEGHIELWVAPDKGYAMQKYRLTKVAGEDLESDGSIFQPETYFSNIPENSVPLKKLIIEGTVEEEQENPLSGQVIPTQVKRISRFENEEGAVDREETIVNTLSKIDFSPDFEALKAFDFPVPNGTYTFLRKKDGRRVGPLKWYDGQLVVDTDNEFYEEMISEAVDQLNGASDLREESSETLSLQVEQQQNSQPVLKRHFSPIAVVMAMLGVLMGGVVCLYLVKRIKNRRMKKD